MRIGRSLASVIAVVTVWPLVYLVLFFVSFFFDVDDSGAASDIPFFLRFEFIAVLHLATMVIMLAVVTFYVVHAFKNTALSSEKRILWVIVLLFGAMIAAPVYWLHYVWRQPQRDE